MKGTVSAISPVICALLALPYMTAGAKERFTVSSDDVDYIIDGWDDGRSLPLAVTFTDFGFKSVYKFGNDGKVVKITADGDSYTVKYRSNGRIRKVTRAGARRDLAEDVDGDIDAIVEEAPAPDRRRLLTCDDCNLAWDTVCFSALETVCDLVGYGDPFLPPAETSLDVFCSTVSALCGDLSASEACSGQCEECLAPLTITLEWSDGSDSGFDTALDLYVIEPSTKLVYWNSLYGDAGERVDYGNKQVYSVRAPDSTSYSTDSTSYSTYSTSYYTGSTYDSSTSSGSVQGQYIVFAEWYGGSAPVSWTMTAIDGNGEVLFAKDGEFTGECGSTTSYSSSESGWSIATTEMFEFYLFEVVDNDCYPFAFAEATSPIVKAPTGRGG